MKDEPYFYLIKKQTLIIRGILNEDNTDNTDLTDICGECK
jgi:hypothetical protein